MESFDYQQMHTAIEDEESVRLLEAIRRDRTRLEDMRREYPGLLASLKDRALSDNVNSSARIEGICLAPERVAELAAGAEAISESEQQIAGYARILKAIDASPEFFTIAASTVLAMHTVLFTGQQFDTRSRYRRKDYQDIVDAQGTVHRIAVSPVNAFETPLYLGSLCDSLAQAFPESDAPELLIPRVVVDFLSIRPFEKGNGRLTRLLTYLLMDGCGLDIAHYMSVDALCERDAMGYYDALNECLGAWDPALGHASDYSPFTRYWLARVHEAYDMLFAQVESESDQPMGKSDRVRRYFDTHTGRITKRDILHANPDISVSTVENVLHDMVAEGSIVKVSTGRTASYERA